jgi:hypothetical protein
MKKLLAERQQSERVNFGNERCSKARRLFSRWALEQTRFFKNKNE